MATEQEAPRTEYAPDLQIHDDHVTYQGTRIDKIPSMPVKVWRPFWEWWFKHLKARGSLSSVLAEEEKHALAPWRMFEKMAGRG